MPNDVCDEPVRDSSIARTKPTEATRIEIWAKSAGRCALCARYLIGDTGFFHTTLVGEVAHIVGATDGTASPRGDSVLPGAARAEATNLFLLCHDCHRRVDSRGMADYYDQAELLALKEVHESRVRDATNFSTLAPTMVLRMSSQIRGTHTFASDRQVSESLRAARLAPATADARDSRFDISLPDAETDEWSWARAESLIEAKVADVLAKARASNVATLAVFALGPIPVLIRLGFALDDKSDVRIMPATRRDDDTRWMWNSPPEKLNSFSVRIEHPELESTDLVAVMNISGSVDLSILPESLSSLTRVILSADEQGPSALSSADSLSAFGNAWRSAVATIEREFRAAKRIHLIAAIPAAAAIELGRAYMKDSQPELVAYQRTSTGYVPVITLR